MKTCKKCVLNDNILSVRINEDGICNYCERQSEIDVPITIAEFERKNRQLLEASLLHRDRPYQVVLAYSGGKDSTYALYLLRKKYNFSVLTVTFDNGFLNEQCRQNIHTATTALGADNIVIKPSFANLAKIFDVAGKNEIFPKKSLERASSICTACIGLVKTVIYKEAILRKVPYISFGWTPGQINLKASIVKLDRKMILANQKQIKEPLLHFFGDEFHKYFISESWMEERQEDIPSLIYPLVFNNYDEHEILDTIQTIGWEKPENTDMNSTNCLLNSYANDIHMKKHGFHPYSLEIAGLIRDGVLTREEGMHRISKPGDENIIRYVKNEIENACTQN